MNLTAEPRRYNNAAAPLILISDGENRRYLTITETQELLDQHPDSIGSDTYTILFDAITAARLPNN